MRNFACTKFEHHKKKSKEKNSTIKIRKGKSTKVELIKSVPVLEESVPWERSKSARFLWQAQYLVTLHCDIEARVPFRRVHYF